MMIAIVPSVMRPTRRAYSTMSWPSCRLRYLLSTSVSDTCMRIIACLDTLDSHSAFLGQGQRTPARSHRQWVKRGIFPAAVLDKPAVKEYLPGWRDERLPLGHGNRVADIRTRGINRS